MVESKSGDRLSAAVGVSGARALRELRLLVSVGVVTLVGAAIALVLHQQPNTNHRVLEAGVADLADVSTHDNTAMLLFYEYVAQKDLLDADSALIGADALAEQSRTASTWRRFADRPAALPGEDRLRQRYEGLIADADGWKTELAAPETLGRLAADPAARAELIAGSTEHSQARVDALGELQRLYAQELAAASETQRASTNALRQDVAIAVAGGLAALLLAFFVLERSGRRRAAMLDHVEALLEAEANRTRLEGQLSRALELCDDEAAAYRVLESAVGVMVEDGGAQLLVADSSLAHLSDVARTGDSTACEVTTPADCPAVRRGHTQEFHSATDLDACPNLRSRGGDQVTTCVPFTVDGTSLGVLHVVSPHALSGTAVTQVELVARRTGERVGVTRAFAKSQDQARTDPLTGLLNRRSLEERSREIIDAGRPYAVVFADLDHFKTLNDVHGHDAGDRALRLFSRCVREAVRPADVASRYGGEEFVFLLPDCDIDGASAVIARLRESVEHSFSAGTVPHFTASFGIDEAIGGPLDAAIARADAALLAAKRAGRNRSVVWSRTLGSGRTDNDPATTARIDDPLAHDGSRALATTSTPMSVAGEAELGPGILRF